MVDAADRNDEWRRERKKREDRKKRMNVFLWIYGSRYIHTALTWSLDPPHSICLLIFFFFFANGSSID